MVFYYSFVGMMMLNVIYGIDDEISIPIMCMLAASLTIGYYLLKSAIKEGLISFRMWEEEQKTKKS